LAAQKVRVSVRMYSVAQMRTVVGVNMQRSFHTERKL